MPRILVTGAAGFLGATTAKRLVQEGWDVVGMDVMSRQDARRLDGVKLAAYEWQSLQDVRRITASHVIHCAAVADVPYAHRSPHQAAHTNVLGTINVCEAAAAFDGFERLIVTSSESVYGHTDRIPTPEDTPMNPATKYGATKAAQELVARSYVYAHGLPVTIIRSSTLFGPGGRMTVVIPIFLRLAVLNQPITVDGDGLQSRDFQFVDNLVDGIMLALVKPEAKGEIFNVAGGNEVTVNQIAEAAIRLTGSKSTVQHRDQRPGEQGLRLVPDISKARRVLGYEPTVSFEEGINATARWIEGMFRPGSIVATTVR